MEIIKAELKAVKTFRGMDGVGYNANLYINGKKAAFCMNEGSGGPDRVEWVNPSTRQAYAQPFAEWCQAHESVVGDVDKEYAEEVVLGAMVDAVMQARDLKRALRKSVLFRKPDETYDEGSWGTFKITANWPRERLHAYIIEQFGEGCTFAK
jgi:sulfopyruvate decarboxylase TPP-binding subunit